MKIASYDRFVAILSLTEIGIGSLLHALRVPFRGAMLSLNQGFVLSAMLAFNKDELTKSAPLRVSAATAVLKSLSPAGKKLTPMLAITMQGALYNVATFLSPNRFLAAVLGSMLCCQWSFIQGPTILWLIYGNKFIDVLHQAADKLETSLSVHPRYALYALVMVISLKTLLSIILAVVAFRLNPAQFEHYTQRLKSAALSLQQKPPPQDMTIPSQNPFVAALADLCHPWFIISLLLNFALLFYVDSDHANLIWYGLRPIAFAYIMFVVVRMLPLQRILKWITTH